MYNVQTTTLYILYYYSTTCSDEDWILNCRPKGDAQSLTTRSREERSDAPGAVSRRKTSGARRLWFGWMVDAGDNLRGVGENGGRAVFKRHDKRRLQSENIETMKCASRHQSAFWTIVGGIFRAVRGALGHADHWAGRDRPTRGAGSWRKEKSQNREAQQKLPDRRYETHITLSHEMLLVLSMARRPRPGRQRLWTFCPPGPAGKSENGANEAERGRHRRAFHEPVAPREALLAKSDAGLAAGGLAAGANGIAARASGVW